MSWLYLLFGLVSVALTVNTFRPIAVGRRRRVAGFFASWLWGELGLHAIALAIVVTWVAAILGALDAWPGQLGLLAVIGSCVALARAYVRGRHAAPAVERALRAALGEDYAERVLPELGRHFESGARWRQIVKPFPIRHPEVERLRDIEFSRERGVTLRLDLYRHRSAPRNCPTLLQIHGGAWVVGDKREQALPLMHQLAARGWVCITANYRLSPHATFPDHLIDIKQAIRWIREFGPQYGANPDFLAVTGGSAGGHLAALVGLTGNDPAYQSGFEHVDTTVRAAVPIYGIYDFTDRHGVHAGTGMADLLERSVMKGSIEEIEHLYRRASPLDLVHEAAPPFFVIHGDLDTLVPVDAARKFVSVLREHSSAPVAYAEIPGAQHAFDLFPSLRAQIVIDAVERFLASVYSQYTARRGSVEEAIAAGKATSVASTVAFSPRNETQPETEPDIEIASGTEAGSEAEAARETGADGSSEPSQSELAANSPEPVTRKRKPRRKPAARRTTGPKRQPRRRAAGPSKARAKDTGKTTSTVDEPIDVPSSTNGTGDAPLR